MEGDKIKTNILIAGKSGVGKSSLLNYIFGEEVSPTGGDRANRCTAGCAGPDSRLYWRKRGYAPRK